MVLYSIFKLKILVILNLAKVGPHKFILNAKSENNKTAIVPLDILISPAISCQPNIQTMMLTNLSVNEVSKFTKLVSS